MYSTILVTKFQQNVPNPLLYLNSRFIMSFIVSDNDKYLQENKILKT